MPAPKMLVCLTFLALAPLLSAQAPPTAYTITQALPGPDGGTMTVYRSGSQALIEYRRPAKPDGAPASRSLVLYDLKAGISHSWDPAGSPITCGAGKFSGDWGDPFEATKELTDTIAKGDLKPAGDETVNGIPTKAYAGLTQGASLKAWLDPKTNLVVKAEFGTPGGPMTTMVDTRSVSFAPPAASIFALPAACAGVKPPPTPAELIADETGDSADNWVSASIGPGSKNTCTILLRVVAAKTMAPINRKYQVAIDTTYDQNSATPPHYVFGVGEDGTSTFSGGGLHEITDQVRNGMLRIDNPPPYFTFSVNIPTPHEGAPSGLIYRQCFAPVTMLYYILKDPSDPGKGTDFLYAKSGKYSTVPAN
jgi:hypothetical protein